MPRAQLINPAAGRHRSYCGELVSGARWRPCLAFILAQTLPPRPRPPVDQLHRLLARRRCSVSTYGGGACCGPRCSRRELFGSVLRCPPLLDLGRQEFGLGWLCRRTAEVLSILTSLQ
jgi:hypothetical protein